MPERKFTVTNKHGEKLVCVEVLPKSPTKKKFPVVILCHGFAYFKEEDGIFVEVAKRLSNIGYAVYYFDFSGCGESDGKYEDTTLTKLIEDLMSVYKTVTTYSYIDSKEVSLMSHSYGSNVIIAAQIKNLKRIVLSGSFANGRKIIGDIFDNFNEHGVSIRKASSGRDTTIGSQFWSDIRNYDILSLVKSFGCPILFIHGGLDRIVPIKNMRPLFAAAINSKGPIILEHSDHDLRPEREIAFRAITDFFSN